MIVEDRFWGVWLSVQDRELHAVTSSPSLVYLSSFLGACLWTCLHARVLCVHVGGGVVPQSMHAQGANRLWVGVSCSVGKPLPQSVPSGPQWSNSGPIRPVVSASFLGP